MLKALGPMEDLNVEMPADLTVEDKGSPENIDCTLDLLQEALDRIQR